jgi:hypothetical protein
MTRLLLSLAALLVLTASGFVHGLWTERWQKSRELEDAAARLGHAPADVGDWQGRGDQLDPATLALAGARGSWVRYFTHRGTGEVVTVILLCGRPGPMSVHRPEHCYRCAGYEMVQDAEHCTVGCPPGGPPAAFWTARFQKEEAGGQVQLRIFWSWSAAAGPWQAPDSPRLTFAPLPALYKLYVVRETGPGQERARDDPCIGFLRQLIPELTRALSPP